MICRHHRLVGLFAILVALVNAAAGDVSAQANKPDTWTTVAHLPRGLLWPAVASAAGKLYVFGGLGGPPCTNFCQTFESYDPHTNRWASMGNMPEALLGLPSATTGPDGRVYAVGGAGYGNGKLLEVIRQGSQGQP